MLTKSKYMNGLQCPRLLWHSNNKLLPELTLSNEHIFSQGHDFEEYVKKLFPLGLDLNGLEFKDNLNKTRKALRLRRTIFEAGFMVEGLYIRADVIKPTSNGWDLYEIKSSTSVKPQHIQDLAFQKYVLEKAGLSVNKCFVIFLNKEYVRIGDINSEELVITEEVTDKVSIEGIEEDIKKFIKVMEMKEYKDIPIGQHCNKPYICPLKEKCWGTLPENNVLQLTNWRVYWKLFKEGVIDLKDVPSNLELNDKDRIVINALEKTQVSKEKVKEFLDGLTYPLYHFDFETFDTAIPIFDNSRPYQKIPFQYSLHIESDKVVHKEFLSIGGDPRIDILNRMKEDLGDKGSIIVYNKSFEISVFKNLLRDFPSEKWILGVISRIVDLADVFRNFYYYDKSQKGSYSIKKVLPAICNESYDDLEINNGGDASMLYFYSHIQVNLENREEIRKNLLKYCKLDTEGMVWIVKGLGEVI